MTYMAQEFYVNILEATLLNLQALHIEQLSKIPAGNTSNHLFEAVIFFLILFQFISITIYLYILGVERKKQ